ncbi:hypothetical protein IIK_00022 [Bacillus cereus VD102]|nr:hypothetical protein IIK_00022 [Bacillus cereus VD102]
MKINEIVHGVGFYADKALIGGVSSYIDNNN